MVLFANSAAQTRANHTKIRSGIELLIPLAERPPQLERALEILKSVSSDFAADPEWSARLLAPPLVRGVRCVSPGVIELSVLLNTHTGIQWESQRELLRRSVVALQQAGIRLALGVRMPYP